ncbi:hypothetical protein E4U54_006537, partial [Claviceps lovelessii]
MTRFSLLALAVGAAAVLVPAPIEAAAGEQHVSPAPLVSTEALQGSVKMQHLWARAEKLYEIAKRSVAEYGHPTRVVGSQGHLGTVDYVKSELAALKGYYNVSEQVVTTVLGHVNKSRLTVASRVPSTAEAMYMTPPTAGGKPVSGKLVLVGDVGCNQTDYPAGLAGNIALIKRGNCSFTIKSERSGMAGAVAAIVYNNEPGTFDGSLFEPAKNQVATFALGAAEGAAYAEQLSKGQVLSATAFVDATVDTVQTTSVIAQTRGGDAGNCVMLSGHSDSVREGPGINDDGSGSLSVLEVAVQLARFSTNNCVRFAWWAAEEEGLVGSNHYAKSLSPDEKRKIRVMMDYDMLASPNFAYQVYNATDDVNPAGSQALRDLYIKWYEDHGLNYTLVAFDGRSDYDGFIKAGIPTGGIATGAEKNKTEAEQAMFGGHAGIAYDVNYHGIGDDLKNLNLTAWEVNSK